MVASEQEELLKTRTGEFFDAVSTGDFDPVNSKISTRSGLLLIGTDPCEWFTTTADLHSTLDAQKGAGITVEHGDIKANVDDGATVGWVGTRGAFILSDGTRVAFRFTGVFLWESGDWKLTQGHVSIGVPNGEALGTDLGI